MKTTHLAPLAGALGLLLGLPASAEKLTIAHGYAPTHMVTSHGIDPWAACVQKGTGGGLEFESFPAG